jgi:purine-cytosine permease-like protein
VSRRFGGSSDLPQPFTYEDNGTVGVIAVLVACFPFVFSQMLPLLTYAGRLVVPVGAIVFAEHFIFPRIGLTR